MFGFHSFSENPFSSTSAVSVGEVKTSVATLNASGNLTADLSIGGATKQGVSELSCSGTFDSNIGVIHGGLATLPASVSLTSNGSIIAPGSSLLLDAGTVTGNGTLLTPIASSLEATGELSSDVSLIRSSEANIIGSGTISSNGTALVPLNSSIESKAELTPNASLINIGAAALSASGSLTSNDSVALAGSSLILNAGTVTANGTLLTPIASSLEASGELSSIGSSAKSSTSLLVDSGTVSAKGTLYRSIKSSLEGSGELTSDVHVVHGGISQFEASGTLGVNESVALDGTSLLLDGGTVSANGTLKIVSDVSVESSGTTSAIPSLIIPHASSISATGVVSGISSSVKVSDTTISSSGTTSNNGTLILGPSDSIQGVGSLTPDASNLISGKAALTSPGATLITGKFAPGELTASLSASSSITAQIGLDLESQATVGNTAKEFLKKTSRPNYKPALPKLSSKGVVLDFPFHEGAGNLRSVSSRRQSGNSNMLMWGRVDGRQSLTSNGGSYNNYRVSFDSTSFDFSDGSLIISFKPTDGSVGYQFLFNNRGTGNNNNEIDIYSLNTQNKVRIDIYNGTSKQTLDVPNLSFNSWNTLVVTFGSDLKASLNGNDFVTYSSITMPSVNSSTSYILGNSDDRFGMVGSVDHFRLYNKQISDSEAKQLHKNIYKDYSLDYIIPNHYEMTKVTTIGRLMKNSGSNISASGQVISRGSFILAQLKAAIGGLGQIDANGSATPLDISTASLQAIATITANGLLLGELDTVSFNVFINRLEDYNVDVYRQFVKEFNVAKLKTVSTSIEQTKITDINIDKILETGLEK
jgi:adhesin HecA-like repeat protein